MEIDEAKIAARTIIPRMEAKLERIIKSMVSKFKGGNLTPEDLVTMRADWLATSRLLTEIETMIVEEKNG